MPLSSGTRLGRYEILAPLGAGGMGEVYKARDPRLGRDVAIKVAAGRFSDRFDREFRAIAALNHPNICTLYDVGPNYLVTELVEGETLRALLRNALPAESSLRIARQVLEALGAAHRAAIVHRDLKPENIMVRFDGYVKVLDFGLAKRVAASPLQPGNTASIALSLPGQILGTIAYMSPEQIFGKETDRRSDLFSFGIVLYEMLTGHHPWPRQSPVDTMHAILHDDPPPIPDAAGAALAASLQQLLRKNPAERYASAEAVLEALSGCAQSQAASDFGATQGILPSIAVLPFVFLSDIDQNKALSLGFADALITVLGSLEDISVRPTSAILKYPAGADPGQVSHELGVRYALQGNVQKLGELWRVSIQIFDAATKRITSSEKYDFMPKSIFELQDEIGRRLVESLQVRFPLAMPKSRDRYSSNPEAYNEFMCGLRESYSDQPETLESAIVHLTAAVECDPEFALAHAWLSYVLASVYFSFDPRRTRLEKAEHHCGRALMLDPASPEAHLARAWILWSPAKNFAHGDAIAELEQVLAVRPNLEQAHNRMSAICAHIGRLPEARRAHEQARRSNPKTRSVNLEQIYLYSGDFASAERAAEAYLKESPGTTYALWFHPLPPLLSGDLDLAEGRLAAAFKQLPDEPLIVSLQGMLHARRNRVDAALECVRRALDFPRSFGHAHHTYYQIACVYAVLRETAKAMAWLERSVETGFGCWPFFRLDPHLESLRAAPEFKALVAHLEQQYTALKIQGYRLL